MKAFLRSNLIFLSTIIPPQLFFTTTATGTESQEGGSPVFAEIQSLVHQVDSLAKAYQLDTAIVLANLALERAREKFGETDTTVASAMSVLARCFYEKAHYSECESLWTKALAIREEKLNPDDPRIASSLHDLSLLLYSRGKYADVEPLVRRALAIREKALGPDDPDVAESLEMLAAFNHYQARYGEVEDLLKRALEIRERALGAEHPTVAVSLTRLGELFLMQDRYAEAEISHRRALQIREKAFGPDHPAVASSLADLALLDVNQGKFAEAEDLFTRALDIQENVLPPDHPSMAWLFHFMARLYVNQNRYAEAEILFKRALSILKSALGSEHPFVATNLHNQALLYAKMGRYVEGEIVARQAVEMWEKTAGPEHPGVAYSLYNLAILLFDQGRYTEAKPFLGRALDIWEKTMGPRHLTSIETLRSLARVYCCIGESDKALATYKRSLDPSQDFIDYVFSYASEEQKMRYLEKYPLIDQSLLSFSILHPSIESKRTALEMILRGKAAVIHAVAAEKEIAYCSYDAEILKKAERHSEVCGEIATLALAGAENLDPDIYRARLETLCSTKDSLETELSVICSEFGEEMASRRFGIDDIVEALPPGAVLWELVRYEPYDLNKIGNEKERTGPARYLAFTLDHSGTIELTDLGDAGEIDSLVALARKRIYRARGEVFSPSLLESASSLAQVTGDLHARIFAPLEKSISETGYVFISPDGELNLLPFEILPCPDGKFVIERYRVSYLSSGRDLLEFKREHEPSDWALLLADPDFDLSGEALARQREKSMAHSEELSVLFEPSRGASECLDSQFDPLPYSRREIESVRKTLERKDQLRVELYDGGKALEEVVKGIETPPRVLHLATHGYFCEDVTEGKMLENPLLRSGLALAGANRPREGNAQEIGHGEDGILTAFEVSGLDLVGTELATLSACETGIGEVRNGEGVYGLRRAFQHAGARAILMSLWKMPDREIYSLMDNFYRNWSDGETKQEALRQATLKLIGDLRAKYGTAHPLLWGGFVLAGNPN